MTLENDVSVDVIIPARGGSLWLPLSLSSIASQSLKPATITIVDDGLDNGSSSRDLGEKLFGKCFRVLKNEGRGISAALNTGVRRSDTHWIARMDADDIAHPDRLKKQVEFLSAHSDRVVGCGTQVRFINSKNKVLGRSYLSTEWSQLKERIQSRTCFVHSSMVIRRDVLLATPYRSSMDGAEDVDLVLRLAENGQVVNLNETLLDYRLHPTQESFRDRARATAIQELAFRLALSRRQRKLDPLDHSSDLAERFIQWRLSDPAYVRSRTFLTALRYGRTYLAGMDFRGFGKTAWLGLKSVPTSWSSLHIAWQVARRAGAALLEEPTPFAELNVP